MKLAWEYASAGEYLLMREAVERKNAHLRRPLRERLAIERVHRKAVAAVVEDLRELSRPHDLAAWEACGGNGGER